MSQNFPLACLGLAAVASLFSPAASAVIIYGDDGPSQNLTDPNLGNTWDLSGNFKGFIGTPISAKHFITADHATGNTNGSISFADGPNTGSYTTTRRYADPDSDLEIWEIGGRFNDWVDLYTDSDEVGQNSLIIGKGSAPGSEVVVADELKGWQWGVRTQAKSWGRNQVSDTFDDEGGLLAFEFNAIDGVNEGALASFDSGGGLFLFDAAENRWELAGIHLGVTGPFSRTGSDSDAFNASLFDVGGLFVKTDEDTYTFVGDAPGDIPALGFSTRISGRLDWINSVVPEPGSGLLLAGAALGLLRRRTATAR